MKRLSISAKLAHKTARPAGGHGYGMSGLIRIETEQARDPCGHPDSSHRRGRVPATIAVERIYRLPDMAHHLQTDNIGVEKLANSAALLFPDGQ